jgi:hypothetical protein
MPSAHPDTLEFPSARPPGQAVTPAESDAPALAAARRRHRQHTFGFWAVALSFVVDLALIAVPTPLYVIYQQRDHFSTIMLTAVYAVYAAGVILSLFLGGHRLPVRTARRTPGRGTFAAGAAIQLATSKAGLRTTLRAAPLILIPGLVLLAIGLWYAILPLFIIGGVVVGAGAALAFRGGLSAAAASAPPKARAEVLSGFFLGTYIGLSVPAVNLGIVTQYVSARSAMLVFAFIVAAAVLLCTKVLRSRSTSTTPSCSTRPTGRSG